MLSLAVRRWILTLAIAAAPVFGQSLETGINLYRAEQYPQAEQELRGVTQNNPENADAHYYLGMTLVELMVAMAIGLFLVGGALYVYSQSRSSYRSGDALARLQESARFALDTLEPVGGPEGAHTPERRRAGSTP